MSLELSSIVFKATTDELDAAVKKIEVLGKSVEGLATSLGKLDKSSAATNKTQAQANLLNAKAEKELAKAIDITDKTTAATEKLTKATREKQSVEERQAAITRLMAEGNSRGQASILATAEALGEATEKTNEYLKAQRAMSSNNPFDRSLGAATVFANELKVATVASDLYNKDLGFTKNQLQELGREHVRMTEQFKIQGKSLAGLDAEFNSVVQSAQKVTQAENAMASSMKNADKATIDAGRANAYIESELQKVRFALQANNEELNRGTANSLVRFENALKKSGLTLDQQKVKIDEYRKAQVELQKTTASNQTDYITRAVGPQITDIVVGLSTGQSPLTVMLQQGGQLRDQFGMMGIAAKDMGDVMRNAMKGMASSVFDTGKAITTMLAGGMFDAGKAVVSYASSFLFVDKAIEKARQGIIGMSSDFDTATENLAKFDKLVGGFGKVLTFGILALVATLASVGVAAVQNIKLMNELNQTLVSVGAKYGVSSTQVVAYSEAISGAGISMQGSIAAMTQMIKAGAGTSESLQSITLTALQLEKAGGQSIEATAKMYAELGKDPVKALSELRLNTGLVTDANMKNIESLVEQGKQTEAVKEAGIIMSQALSQSTSLLYAEMTPLQQLWIDMKGSLTNIWNGVNDLATSAGLVIAFRIVWESVALVVKDVFTTIKGMSTAVVAVLHGDWAGAVDILKETFGTVADNYTEAADAVAATTEKMTAGVKVQTEAVKQAQEQAKAEKVRLYNKKIEDELDKKLLSQSKKQVTQQEYINRQLDEYKKNADYSSLSTENLAKATKAFGEEWKRAQPKAKKVQLTQEQKDIIKGLEERVDLENKVLGVNKEYNNQMYRANLLFETGNSTQEQRQKSFDDIEKAQPRYTASLAAQKKLIEDMKKDNESILKLKEDSVKFISDETKKTQDMTATQALRLELLGKTEEEQKKITQQVELQNKLNEANNDYEKQKIKLLDDYEKAKRAVNDESNLLFLEKDKNDALIALAESRAERERVINRETAVKAAEEFQKAFDAIKSTITDSITSALFDGGKSGSKKIKDAIVSALRSKVTLYVDAVVNTVMQSGMNALGLGASAGGSGGGSGGFGGLMNGVSSVSGMATIGQGIANILPASFSSALGLTSSALQTSNAALLGGGSSANAAAQAAAQAGNATSMASMASTAGSILSYASALNSLSEGKIGAAAGTALGQHFGGPLGAFIGGKIGSALDEAFAGETRSGASYTSANGKSLFEKGPSGGEIAGYQSRLMMDNAMTAITKTLNIVGSKATLTGFVAGLESSDKNKGFAYAGGTVGGKAFGENLGRDGGQFEMISQDAKTAFANYGKQLSQSILEALQVTEDIPKSLKAMLEGVDIAGLTSEETDALLTTVNTLVLSVSGFKEGILSLPFDSLKNLSFDAAAGLIAASGGMDKLVNNLVGFFDHFYTGSEKVAVLTKNTGTEFSKLGIVMPAVNKDLASWYRAEVERTMALDQSIPANAKATAGILSLEGSVYSLSTASTDAAEAIVAAGEKLRDSARNADKVAVQLGLTTDIGLAKQYANEAWTTFKEALPQASGYSEAEIVSFARDPKKMGLLGDADKAIINTFVDAIGDWNTAQTTEGKRLSDIAKEQSEALTKALKEYTEALKSITDQTTGFIIELSEIGMDSFTIALNKIKRDGATKLTELNALGAKTGSSTSRTGDLTGYASHQGAALSAWKTTGDDTEYARAMAEASRLYASSVQEITGSISDNVTVVDAWVKAHTELLYAKKAQTEKVDLEKQYNDLTKTSAQLLKEQRDALEESNLALFDSVQLLKDQKLAAQATSDYNVAMADATGNTKESARLQREVANATKLANGWTQVQIDTLNRAVDAAQSLVNLKSGLDSLESARTAVVSAFKAIEDAAKNTQAAVDSAKEAITQGYVNAVEQQTQAQEVINDLIKQAAVEMAGFATSIRDFLLQMSTTDIGADSKLSQLGALIGDFNETANKAKGGDTKAYGSITGKASSLLTAGKDQFSTAIEFARFSSNIGNTLAELATIADGKAGPLAEAVDPMVKAQADLLKANQEVAKWTLAVSESGAATSLTVADYAQDWRKANADNIKAQADLLAAQLLTKDINKQLVTVLGDLAALISVYNTANKATPVYGGSAPTTKVGTSYLGAGSDIKTIQDLYSVNLGREGDIAGMEFWSKAFLGDGVIDAAERQQFAMAAIPEYLSKLSSFAVGTNYVPSDMTANLHAGERIIPAADNQELMQRLSSPMTSDNSELIQEIQYLNNRLAIIESNTASTAGHAAKTARLLDRAMPDGDAIATRVAAAI